ncbi:hypothetical protein [Cohnella rhizosphaerae]|uniref:Uncharacterized protein n=1 Tax=Cohnella rhizosphaerae TaxID=1457232 RepID=A0A9X4KTC4_9BACL|nr:hypothetical protein [Cohnella rhizosphaerae]MDG0810711.1 hypothetical protein [Cohnella rhizosphaerae]
MLASSAKFVRDFGSVVHFAARTMLAAISARLILTAGRNVPSG